MSSSTPSDASKPTDATDTAPAPEASASPLRRLFEAAAALPTPDRRAFLDAHCADADMRERLRLMLVSHDEDAPSLGIHGASALAAALDHVDAATVLPIGARVGSFELLEILGEGGTATVYRARRERQGVTQYVALKLLHGSLHSTVRRQQFDRERQALSQLQHPNIARLIEGDVSAQGQAFIALELVEGSRIGDYVRAHRLGMAPRLRLFAQVCRAVETAHHALIVHRDLKPQNVMVTADGQVKVLDFGIAKLLDAEADDRTQTALRVLTPAYAAPEQFHGGPITTATDVYALGMLLGEILTGQRPTIEGPPPSAQVATGPLADGLPLTAAKWRKLMRGDLDNLILKAIAPNSRDRYVSAGALADDIDRLLDGRPVVAHPPSRAYRLGKFIKRHRVAVFTGGSLALALLAAFAGSMWQSSVARREATRANALREFLVTAFAQAEPSTPRAGPPRITEVVADAVKRARNDPRMDAGTRIDLLNELGAVQREQGDLSQASATLEANYADAIARLGEDDELSIRALRELATTLTLVGDYPRARALIDRQLPLIATTHAAERAKLLMVSSLLWTKQRDLARAAADGEKGLALTRALGDGHALGEALSQISNVQFSSGDATAAITTLQELLAIRERELGPRHLGVATLHANLSRVYCAVNRIEDGEREIRAALAIDAQVLDKNDWRRGLHLNALIMVLNARRDFAGALDAAEEALRIDRAALGDEHPYVANDLNSVGMLHLRLEHAAEAVDWLARALAASVSVHGAEHLDTAIQHANYGMALHLAGRSQDGESELTRAIAIASRQQPLPLDTLADFYRRLVRLEIDRGNTEQAMHWLARVDALPAFADATSPAAQAELATLRAAAFVSGERWREAREASEVATAAIARVTTPDAAVSTELALLRATIATRLDEASLAQASINEALARFERLANPPGRSRAMAQALRGR